MAEFVSHERRDWGAEFAAERKRQAWQAQQEKQWAKDAEASRKAKAAKGA